MRAELSFRLQTLSHVRVISLVTFWILVAFGLPFAAVAGGPGKGSVLMNGAVTQQVQLAAVGVQAQNAQNAARNLGQTGFSVFKGNNGVTFIRLKDPTAVPSNVLRTFKADGKVYAIDRNGIIFGGPHQVNTGAVAAAAMDATSNSQTKQAQEKLGKPVQTSVPSIITAEVVGYGK